MYWRPVGESNPCRRRERDSGPSAGVAMVTSIVSAVTGIEVRRDVAMTGEISLRGKVLPVGGIKEKVLAAARAGMREVILPEKNGGDLEEIPEHLRNELTFHLIDRVEEALKLCLDVELPPLSAPSSAETERDGGS